MAQFQGLAQLDAMQRAPLGTYSALRRPSPAASQYKRQASMYGQALRLLTRAARRGDARAALKAIDVGNDAMGRGFSPGGIRDAEGFKAEANQFDADMAQGAADMGQKERLDRRFAGSTLSREPVNRPATPGAGYGTPLGRPRVVGQFEPGSDLDRAEKDLWTKPKPGAAHDAEYMSRDASPEDLGLSRPAPTPLTEEEKRRELTRSGAFGSGAADILKRKEKRMSILDRATTLDLPNTYRA